MSSHRGARTRVLMTVAFGVLLVPAVFAGPPDPATTVGEFTDLAVPDVATDDRPRSSAVKTAYPAPVAVAADEGPRGQLWARGADVSDHDLPARAARAYRNAAARVARTDPSCALPWTLLAAIGRVESDHGRYAGASLGSDGVSRPQILGLPLDGSPGVSAVRDTDEGRLDGDRRWDRAVGPMQFIPGTWDLFSADGDRDGRARPHDLDDAALAAAGYLCAGSAAVDSGYGMASAIYSYNHDLGYVRLVMSFETGYRTGVFTQGRPLPTQGPFLSASPISPTIDIRPATLPEQPPGRVSLKNLLPRSRGDVPKSDQAPRAESQTRAPRGSTRTPDDDTPTRPPGVPDGDPPARPGNEGPDSEGPGTEGPGTEGPGTEGPGTEGPGTEDPGNEGPGTEGPGNEGPGNEGPGDEGPGDEGPGDGPKDPGPTDPGPDEPVPTFNDDDVAFVTALVQHDVQTGYLLAHATSPLSPELTALVEQVESDRPDAQELTTLLADWGQAAPVAEADQFAALADALPGTFAVEFLTALQAHQLAAQELTVAVQESGTDPETAARAAALAEALATQQVLIGELLPPS